MVKHWTWKSAGSPNPGATGRSIPCSNICSPLSLSTDTCKCSTISKRPHRKAVDVNKRNKIPAEHKCFECGGLKTWGMWANVLGPALCTSTSSATRASRYSPTTRRRHTMSSSTPPSVKSSRRLVVASGGRRDLRPEIRIWVVTKANPMSSSECYPFTNVVLWLRQLLTVKK